MGRELDAVETFPAASVSVEEIFHVPSVSVGSVQFVDVPMTYEHDTVVLPLVAEMVIVSPFAPPLALIVGVVSFVLLSVDDVPVSEAVARSTAVGAVGRDVSTVIDSAVDADDAPLVGCESVAVINHVPSDKVPRSQPVAGMTYVHVTLVAPDRVAVTVMVLPAA
jgi:hypothetical protein